MTSLRQCEVCGTDIAPGPLGDVCPVCLLREGHTEFAGLDVADALAAGASDFQDRSGLPRAFGGYDLLEEIAHGGMGIVYRARHRALNREVALKLLLAGAFASPEFVRRFQREAAAAASLRHPHIVGVHEVGEVDGQPFLALEYVAGQTLAEMVRERPLPARDAARYVQIVAEAVQHAHDHGLLHRDLKPSNVLVDLDDQPRVTDFGLAKQMDGSTDLTVTGQMLGSPNYLSPEAALGRENQLSPASDVYSLGATFYHLLTGRPPLLAGSLAETLVQVREQTAIAPRLLNPSVPGDLETICLKCLEKEPARRYGTARELADELGRWRRGEPIRARPAPLAERAWKWACRRPAQAALAGTVMLATAAVVVTSLWFNVRLTAARDAAEGNRRLAETNRLTAELSANASREALVRMQVVTGNRLMAEGDPLAAALWFAEALRAEPAVSPNARAGLPHRRRLAAAWAAAPRLVRVVPLSAELRAAPFGPRPSPTNLPFRLEPRADGRLGVVRADGTAVSFTDPAADGTNSEGLPNSFNARAVTLNADGHLALVFARDGSHRVWRLDTGHPLMPALPLDSYGVPPQWRPDGEAWLRVWGESGRWFMELRRVTDPATPLLRATDSHLFAFVFDPDSRWLATAHWDGGVRLWDADTLAPLGPPLRHSNGIEMLAVSPDGARLATGGWGQEVRVWSVPEGRLLTPPLRLDNKLAGLAFSPEGRQLFATTENGPAMFWDLFRPELEALPGLTNGVQLLAVNPQGAIAAWQHTGRAHFWRPGKDGYRHRMTLPLENAWPATLELSPDSQWAAAALTDGRVPLWRTDSGELQHVFVTGTNALTHLAFSPDGRWLVAASSAGVAHRLELTTGRQFSPALGHGGHLHRVAFSPDSRRVATAGADHAVRLWDSVSGERVGELSLDREVVRVSFSPAGTHLLTAQWDGTADGLDAQLWDVQTLRAVGRPMGHPHGVAHAMFFPDGTRVLTATEESEARVWSVPGGTPLTPWIRCGRRILRPEVSPDGLTVLTVDEGFRLRLWDAASGELLSASGPGETVHHAAFVGADRVVFGAYPGPLRLLDLPAERGSVNDLLELARLTAGHELDATGGLALLPASALLESFIRLQVALPERFALRPAADWHRQQVERAMVAGDAFAGEFHRRALERVAADPGDGN